MIPNTVQNPFTQSVATALDNALSKVMGLRLEQLQTPCRQRFLVYGRMIFAHRCLRAGVPYKDIATLLGRERTSVLYFLKTYDEQMRTNRCFRKLATEVKRQLNTQYEKA